MNIRQEINRGLAALEPMCGLLPSIPQSFIWKEAAVDCIATSLAAGIVIDSEGNAITADFRLFVRCVKFLTADSTLITVDSDLYTTDSDLPTPVAGRTLIFRGRTYRIITAKVSGVLSHFELTIREATSNQ